jgi:ABC-type transporter MlaC component
MRFVTTRRTSISVRSGAAARLAFALACLALAAGFVSSPARANDQSDAVALVQQVREAAVALAYGGAPDVVEAERDLIGAAFDGTQIGRTVLGTYWNTASAADRAGVIDALLDAIARGLADRLANTREQDFVVLGTQLLANGDILVRSQFVRPLRQPSSVDWRLHRCQGKLCIGDVILDGASVTLQRRDQVTAQLAGNGGSIPKLIADIREGRL